MDFEEDTISTRDAQKKILLLKLSDFKKMIGLQPYHGTAGWKLMLSMIAVAFLVMVVLVLVIF